MTATLSFTEELLRCPSLTPNDAGCQDLIAKRLEPLGFRCETIESGPDSFRVRNLWAKRLAGSSENRHQAAERPTFVFAGHTDVVPTGPLNQWESPPFVPEHRDGKLFGRGASDMKSSLAAFVVAIEEFLQKEPAPKINIALLITSDEEGPSVDGTAAVCRALQERGERLDFCVVGEPTSVKVTGDMIKNGRRGSLSGRLIIKGIQGHIAYPHLAKNPIHLMAPALAELAQVVWDKGNDFFPPTTWQVSNVHGGTGASNVIPGHVILDFNFRFSTESTPESLQARFESVVSRHGFEYELHWTLGGRPFLTTPGPLVDAVKAAILEVTGLQTELSTTGGTSDGRFIAQICPQVVELGPPNDSIHKVNEYIRVSEIEPLKNIYRRVLETVDGQARG